MGNEALDNVYSMVYLGAEIASDGDQKVTFKHRCDIAWGCFAEHRRVLKSTKLPTSLRLGLYAVLVISTMVYGAVAWMFIQETRKSLNGVSSKMSFSVTRRSLSMRKLGTRHLTLWIMC